MTRPLRILCQSDAGSCAACCGVYNFRDRSPAATDARLQRRTEAVQRAWPDEERLAAARDALMNTERDEILFSAVRVCPFAGYVEPGRVGCLLHPTRHPAGADLRDLGVYPKEVCRDHFCAPHDWLKPREVAFAQTAQGIGYGLVVTDAGLVKALLALLEGHVLRPLRSEDFAPAAEALRAFWEALLAWPYRDPDPQRFGGFYADTDDAIERTLPSCLAGLAIDASPALRTALDGLGTRVAGRAEAEAAIAYLHAQLARVASAIADR